MYHLGNLSILKLPKTGFLCSRKVPSGIILKTYDWAIEQRDKGVCVVSGFHSKIEKDVMHYLLKGDQPLMMVLARGMKKRWSEEILTELNKDRLLIITPFEQKNKRVNQQTALHRDRLITELAEKIFVPYCSPGGVLDKLLSSLPPDKQVISF